ncbi:MAG TPA: hypothetical protein VMR62_12635 [Bryobacteraceae bacterium]|jgi:hypothetical protein|nr:hypothetical protein [Bryobacteraceae bacterium]
MTSTTVPGYNSGVRAGPKSRQAAPSSGMTGGGDGIAGVKGELHRTVRAGQALG